MTVNRYVHTRDYQRIGKKFYHEAGFITEDSIGFWYKEIV